MISETEVQKELHESIGHKISTEYSRQVKEMEQSDIWQKTNNPTKHTSRTSKLSSVQGHCPLSFWQLWTL